MVTTRSTTVASAVDACLLPRPRCPLLLDDERIGLERPSLPPPDHPWIRPEVEPGIGERVPKDLAVLFDRCSKNGVADHHRVIRPKPGKRKPPLALHDPS